MVQVYSWRSGGWTFVRLPCLVSSFVVVSRRFSSFRAAACRHNSMPMGKVAKGVIFGCFKCDGALFRVASAALCDIWTCMVTCRKSFCVAGAILLQRFQNMSCVFRGRCNTLDVSSSIFRGRRSTSDVLCCVFFANRIGRAARSGDKVQIAWQAWHFVRCDENWRPPRTKHRF